MLVSAAQAEVIGLYDYGCHIDGVSYNDTDPFGHTAGFPASVDDSGINGTLTDQDSLTVTVTGASAHTVICVFDYDIDEALNTFFNEAGETGGGALAAGQSWEIDEPDFMFGDINANVDDGVLDNTNGVPGFPDSLEDDVAFAIGFDFTLAAGETAVVSFFLDVVNNAPGFFLRHFDPDSIIANDLNPGEPGYIAGPNQIYAWGDLDIQGGGGGPGPMPVPEPATLGLLGLGLIGIAGIRRRRSAK
jgi:hypothetical protein